MVSGRSVTDVLDDGDPLRMPVQAVQRYIRSSSPNTSCEVLPLSGVYGLSVEVMGLAAHETGFFVGVVDGGEVMEEVHPVEGIQLEPLSQVHDCGGTRARVLGSRTAGSLITTSAARSEVPPSWPW